MSDVVSLRWSSDSRQRVSLEPIVILEGACVCLVVARVSWPVPSLSTASGPSRGDGWRPRLPVPFSQYIPQDLIYIPSKEQRVLRCLFMGHNGSSISTHTTPDFRIEKTTKLNKVSPVLACLLVSLRFLSSLRSDVTRILIWTCRQWNYYINNYRSAIVFHYVKLILGYQLWSVIYFPFSIVLNLND